MGLRSLVCAGVFIVGSLVALIGEPCTTVLLERGGVRVVAKSYDYHLAHGMILINPRGLAKRSMPVGRGSRAAAWVSRYGSVTFNQYGRELPCGGMNEAGLVVEVMWLAETMYPPPDGRPALPDLQWIQYQLDRWGSVEEVVTHAAEVRVDSGAARVHYLVCDAAGACAAFEYLDGRLVVTAGAALPVPVLTNDTYAASLAFASEARQRDPGSGPPLGTGSLERFARAAAAAVPGRDQGEPGPVDDGFAVLDDVSQGTSSVWNLVYQPGEGRVHYRTREHRRIKHLDIARFDFACDRLPKALDLDSERWGDVSASFHDLSVPMHRSLVRKSFADHFAPVAKGTVEHIVSFAHTFRCAAPSPT